MIDWQSDHIVITGGTGFVGSHLVEYITANRGVTRDNLSILSSRDDARLLENCLKMFNKGDVVFHLAGDIGAIAYSSSHNASQLFNNATIGLNVVEACRIRDVKKLIIASSICAYPDETPIPFREESLFRGEPTWSNYGYGTSKRLLVSLARCYKEQYGMNVVVLLGSNVFGPRDNFEPEMSHAIPSLIRQFVENETVTIWGDGSSSRDYLYVRDFARALLLASERLDTPDPVNVGSGKETTIAETVKILSGLVTFKGKVRYDRKALVGQRRRAVDITRARAVLGYEPEFSIEKGIAATLAWYLEERSKNVALST